MQGFCTVSQHTNDILYSCSASIHKTGPAGAVAKSSANGLVGTGFASRSNPERVFKDPMGRCKATTPSSLSLTSNRFTTNYSNSVLDRQPS